MTMSASALLADCSLRERKRARLRVGLWTALRERIEAKPFSDISVRELAAAVEVSEPTFFAHFSSKSELLSYHICMWRIGTVLDASAAADGVAFLRRFFDRTAEAIIDGPRMWFEITAEVARGGGLCAVLDISPPERLLVFDDPAALHIAVTPQADLFAHHLAIAKTSGHLVGTVPDAVTALLAGFYGIPLALGHERLDDIAGTYSAHLDRFVSTKRTR
jgi:AcrR family transcriptional regulator